MEAEIHWTFLRSWFGLSFRRAEERIEVERGGAKRSEEERREEENGGESRPGGGGRRT